MKIDLRGFRLSGSCLRLRQTASSTHHYDTASALMSQYCRDTEQAHINALLQEAIAQWRADQPRRWLAKYGGWSFEGKNPLVLEYRELLRQAKTLVGPHRWSPRFAKPSIDENESGGDCSHRSGFRSRLPPLSLMEFADGDLYQLFALTKPCSPRVFPITV